MIKNDHDLFLSHNLRLILSKHTKLFDGTLGKYPDKPMHINLEEGTQSVYCHPYLVPLVYMDTFHQELNRLVNTGVLSQMQDTEWGLPMFIMPKKDGHVKWVADMRELNKVVKQM